MGAVTTLPRGRALTVADLVMMPDDGHRYELIDGALIVTPAPSSLHQLVHAALMELLLQGRPEDLRVLSAPLDVVLDGSTSVQPDLLVTRRSDLAEQNLPVAPLLVVEILSPSTRLIDLNLKRARYERAGVASYWVVDPEQPRLTAWELRQGRYVEVGDVAGDEEWAATSPYDVTIVPGRLID
jgi:Uma2 family endonuclease